jgi:N-acetylglutamate synthase-like GNAT family acetyltransferase
MTNSLIGIERLAPHELGELRVALASDDMPVDDIEMPGCMFFRVGLNGHFLGFAGLQGTGAQRLLRSVWIAPKLRGLGHGAALVGAVEGAAQESGCSVLHLLTMTARAFFVRLGYVVGDRAQAPREIAAHAEFSSLCPATAAYLLKRLGDGQ